MLRRILIGLGVYLAGFIVVGLTVSIFNDSPQFSFMRAIVFLILYLSAVIAVCASFVLGKTNNN